LIFFQKALDIFLFNFSYPKKIVNSIIENEYLAGRPNFRYKKVVLLMGANATGKTSLGKALSKIFKFVNSGNTSLLLEMTEPNSVGGFTVDFVNDGYILHRLSATIDSENSNIELKHAQVAIDEKDSYEKCVAKLAEAEMLDTYANTLKKKFGELDYRFAYPEIETALNLSGVKQKTLFKTLKAVIGTLDPLLRTCLFPKIYVTPSLSAEKERKSLFKTESFSTERYFQAERKKVLISLFSWHPLCRIKTASTIAMSISRIFRRI